jgi:hypothetical protein
MHIFHQPRFIFLGAALVALTLCGDAQLGANEAGKAKEMQLAALALPSTARATGSSGFIFTFAVKRLAQELRPCRSNGEVFLDARYQLAKWWSGHRTRCRVVSR